jgi:hypothetical protein
MNRFNRGFFASWDRWRVELHDLEQCSPGACLASGIQHGIGKGSRVQTSMPTFIAIRFRHRIVYIFDHRDRAASLKAVGLEE